MGIMADVVKYTLGDAWTAQNPDTGDYLIGGQKRPDGSTEPPYLAETAGRASQLLQSIDHYNRTGEAKRFKVKPLKSFTASPYLSPDNRSEHDRTNSTE